jgi:hypothetical protein
MKTREEVAQEGDDPDNPPIGGISGVGANLIQVFLFGIVHGLVFRFCFALRLLIGRRLDRAVSTGTGTKDEGHFGNQNSSGFQHRLAAWFGFHFHAGVLAREH